MATLTTGSDVDNVKITLWNDGTLFFGLNDTGTALTSIDYGATLTDGEIHSLAISWDNTNGDVSVYIDGAFVESATGLEAGNTLDGTGTFVLGHETDGDESGFSAWAFQGALYDVRVWDDVRSES